MPKPKMFEKPAGVKDLLPEALEKLRSIESRVLECMRRWGYSEIMTPTLEYYDTVGAVSSTSDHKLFKLLDRNGTTLVMRPDMTSPIARVVASLLKERSFPIRLSYHANVFRAMEEEAGRESEFYQAGVELVGDKTADADAEIVALAISALKAAGVRDFNIALGHVGFLNGLLDENLPDLPETQSVLKECLMIRDYVGYRNVLAGLELEAEARHRLEGILRLQGDEEVCLRAQTLTANEQASAAIRHLREMREILSAYDVAGYVSFDLTMIGNFSYYTGMIFEGYAAGHGFPVASGGRYDNLLAQFGRPAPATGFALKTNRILEIAQPETGMERQRTLVVYAAHRRAEAIRYAAELRSRELTVETRRLEAVAGGNVAQPTEGGGYIVDGVRYAHVAEFI